MREHLEWFKETINKHKKNPYFYIFSLSCIYLFKKIWVMYIFFLIYINISIIVLLFKKDAVIYINNSKVNNVLSCIKINILNAISNTKISKKNIIFIVFIYMFKIVVGVSYKLVRTSISLFDCMYDEYYKNKIYKKKIKYVYKRYIKNSLEILIMREFVKNVPTYNDITVETVFFKKKIRVDKSEV